MSHSGRVVIESLPSGIPGLDVVLGGGIPQYSFNLIAGAPGTGKTTLAQQIMFANATVERPALHFTVLGEPPVKMLRYQQQFDFFDLSRVGSEVFLLNLTDDVLQRNLDAVLERITAEVQAHNPGIVVVDSFRTVMLASQNGAQSAPMMEAELQHFVQRLALRLTNWEATTFLIGEYTEMESRNPVFTVADGILWLTDEVERNSTVRKMRVSKTRGRETLSGLHTFRIGSGGIELYPRQFLGLPVNKRTRSTERLGTGIPELDVMLHGGIPKGDSVMVGGPTGTGKSIIATQFLMEGLRRGEHGVLAVFEEHPDAYVARAEALGFELGRMQREGLLDIMYLQHLDLSVDETLDKLERRVMGGKATRLVIDSLTGFEVALAPTFREDLRDSFYRLIGAVTSLGVTVLSTMELTHPGQSMQFTPHNISFLTDDLISLRYVEIAGNLHKVIAIVKMRGSGHSTELRRMDITSEGIRIGEVLSGYRGITTGVPEPSGG